MTIFTPYKYRRTGNLLGWDPARLLEDLMSWQPAGGETVWSAQAPIRVHHDDDGATITVDMPGVDPQDLDVELEAGVLTIAGKRGEHAYRYRVTLGDALDASALEANLDKGVLSVRAPRKAETKPRKIPVNGPAAATPLAGEDAPPALASGAK
jgi:HSP20 family protein